MGFLSKFEGKMEDTFEGTADKMFDAPISPVQIAKKAEKQMRREKMVGAGKQYAPTLYTVLVNPDDDRRLFGYYPTLAGETETYLAAKASEQGLVMDGQPLVRFIVDEGLKHGKFDVIAEAVAAPIISQLRDEEMQRYGLAPQGGGYGAAAAAFQPQQYPQGGAAVPEQAYAAQPYANQPYEQPYAQQPHAETYGEANGYAAQPYAQQPYQPAPAPEPEPQPGYVAGGYAEPEAHGAVDPFAFADASMAGTDLAGGMPGQAAATPYAAAAPAAAAAAGAVGAWGAQHQAPKAAQPAPQPAAQPQAQPFAADNTVMLGDAQGYGAAPQPAAQPQQAPRFRLVDRAANRAYNLNKPHITIGRESKNDIALQDINASRSHAELQFAQGAWMLTDLNSTNGTYINGQRISRQPLSEGDLITVGMTNLVFTRA